MNQTVSTRYKPIFIGWIKILSDSLESYLFKINKVQKSLLNKKHHKSCQKNNFQGDTNNFTIFGRLKIKYMKQKFFTFGFTILLLFSCFNFLHSQNLEILYDFDVIDGRITYGELISDGTYLYGMSNSGGAYDKGTVYKIKKDGSDFVKLLDFDGENGDGAYASLTLVGSELFGVGYRGGELNRGTIFKLNTDGTGFTKLIDFGNGNTGFLAYCTLFFDGEYLYGTTYGGGSGVGSGMVFKLKTDGSDFSVIHNFGLDVSSPNHNLVSDGDYLYGTAFNGGDGVNNSTLYKLKKDGSIFQKLHDFPDNLENTNVEPAGLLLIGDFLYGVTLYGENDKNGYLYKIETDGTNFEILHDFIPQTGVKPRCILAYVDDYLFGTTSEGGGIFKIKTDGSDFENIFVFDDSTGNTPFSGLLYEDGLFYGTTIYGGDNQKGTIFVFDNKPLSTNEIILNRIKITPNPTVDFFSVTGINKSGVNLLELFDSNGKLILKTEIIEGMRVSIGHLPKGIYFVKLENQKAIKLIKK